MTTKRKLILILVIAAVLAAGGAGVAWWVRRNTGPRLLARTQLALDAGKFNKAEQLAHMCIARQPDDWQGYYLLGQVNLRLGRYESARQQLGQALERTPAQVDCQMLLADTWSIPARQLLSTQTRQTELPDCRRAIEQLQQANALLERIQTDQPDEQLDLLQARALNHERIGFGYRLIARQLDRQAELTATGIGQKQVTELRSQARKASQASIEAITQAERLLIEVVKDHPGRELAARVLVRLLLSGQSQASHQLSEEIRRVILDQPGLDIPKTMLWMSDLQKLANQPARQREQMKVVVAKMDKLLAGGSDHTQLKVARAELASRLGELDLAEKILQDILNDDTGHQQARMLLATLRMVQGRPDEAETILFALKTDYPSWTDAHYAYAEAALATGKSALARQAMRTVTMLDPTHAGARRYLAELLWQDGFYTQAFTDAEAYYQSHPDDPAALRLFVALAIRTEKPNLARTALDAARSRAPKDPGLLLAIAEGYTLLGQRDLAARVAGQALDDTQIQGRDALLVARARLIAGQTAEAETLLRGLLETNPQNGPALMELAGLYRQTGRSLQAIERYRQAAQIEPNNIAARQSLAETLFSVGMLEAAQNQTEQILAIEPLNADAAVLAGQIRILRGETIDTEPLLAGPEESPSGMRLAMTCLRTGQTAKAEALLRKELTSRPKDVAARQLLAEALLAGNTPDEALDELRIVIAEAPGRMPAYLRAAGVLARTRTPEQVRDWFQQLPTARMDHIEMAMAWLYARRGDPARAGSIYAALADRATASPDLRDYARLLAAGQFVRAGQLARARNNLQLLEDKPVWTDRAQLALLDVLRIQGKTEEMLNLIDTLANRARQEKNLTVLDALTIFARQIGQYDRADAIASAAAELYPANPGPVLLRASVAAAQGQFDRAIKLISRARDLQPDNLQIHVLLARAIDSQGRLLDALAVLDRLAQRGQAGELYALFERARMLASWGLVGRSIDALEKIQTLREHSEPQVQFVLGRSLAILGQDAQARLWLEKVPAYSPLFGPARVLLADLADDDAAALAVLMQAIDQAGPDANLITAAIVRLNRQNDYDRAITLWQRWQDSPDRPMTIPPALGNQVVLAMVRRENLTVAAELCESLAAQSGNRAWTDRATLLKLLAGADIGTVRGTDDLLATLIHLAAVRGKPGQAWQDALNQFDSLAVRLERSGRGGADLAAYRVLVAVMGKNLPTAERTAKTFAGSGVLLPQAVAGLVDLARAEPDKASAQAEALLLASVAARLELPVLARDRAGDILDADPTSQWAAGLAYSASPTPATARELLDVLRPADTLLARLLQARLASEAGDYTRAAELYAQAAAGQDNPQLLLDQAIALERAGQYPKALALYRTVWDSTQNPIAANNAAYVVTQIAPDNPRQVAEVKALVEQAQKAMPNEPAFLDTLGWLNVLQGNDAEARALLVRAVRGLPRSPQVHFHLAMVEKRIGQTTLARWHFQAAVRLGEALDPADADPAALRAVAAAREQLQTLPAQP